MKLKASRKQEGTIYVVSALVLVQRKDRDDLFVPNDTVRDENYRIIAVGT